MLAENAAKPLGNDIPQYEMLVFISEVFVVSFMFSATPTPFLASASATHIPTSLALNSICWFALHPSPLVNWTVINDFFGVSAKLQNANPHPEKARIIFFNPDFIFGNKNSL